MTDVTSADTIVVVTEQPTDLTVTEVTQIVEVAEQAPTVEVSEVLYTVEVTSPGPQGRPGADGSAFDYAQVTPQASWPIEHNLNKRPSVTVYNPDGQIEYPDVAYVDANNVVVIFPEPETGYAHLV